MMSGRGDEQRDVVQDTFVEALGSVKNLRGDVSSLEPWLRAVTRNVVRGFYRKEQRLRWQELCDPEEIDLVSGNAPGLDASDLRDALRALPPREARALLMRHLEGRGLDEMARLLGLSVSSVKRSLSRGRSRARRRLTWKPDWDSAQAFDPIQSV